jgi:hypothetical protein
VIQAAELAAEKAIYFVIPSEARNLSRIETQEKRDSLARSAYRWRLDVMTGIRV